MPSVVPVPLMPLPDRGSAGSGGWVRIPRGAKAEVRRAEPTVLPALGSQVHAHG